MDDELFPLIPQDPEILNEIEEKDLSVANIFRYVSNYARFPVWSETDITYYSDALEGLEAQKADLRKAERFIFMEYHAIEDKEAFQGIKEILIEKVREGGTGYKVQSL